VTSTGRIGIKTGVLEVNVVTWRRVERVSSVNEERSGARDLAKKRAQKLPREIRRRRVGTIAGF